MLRIPRGSAFKEQAKKIIGSRLVTLPRYVTNIIFNCNQWQSSEISHYNPGVVAYKPPQHISKREKIIINGSI